MAAPTATPKPRAKNPNPRCHHPAPRLYTWFARDDRLPAGRVLVVCCLDCHAVLRGAAKGSQP
jgi:hypothetical protein